MTATPINGLPSPDDNSPNDPPIHFGALTAVLDSRLNARFATEAARDQAITDPVNGMVAWIDNLGAWTERAGSAWLRRYPSNAYGALCRPVKLSKEAGQGIKYAAPTGGGYFEMGRTPGIAVPANRTVRVEAPVSWTNGGSLTGVGVRFERYRTDATGFDIWTAEQTFFIGGPDPVNSVVDVHHWFNDEIAVAGVYSWRLAAKTTTAGNTAGIAENAWAWLTATAMGPIPGI